jgi:D-hydroxyproline dehydrogenase subunit alpha
MNERFDLVVVGAGPGGLASAATAAECGLRVCLIDDNPVVGGQMWRAGVARYAHNPAAQQWLRRIRARGVTVLTGWRVVSVHSPSQLRVEQNGRCKDLVYSSLILATGARELFLPFPGWTLPGVYGIGGLQAFVKSGLNISGKRIVIAGTGPLLLAVAAGLRRAGARIEAVIEQAPLHRLTKFSLRLMAGNLGKVIEGGGYAIQTMGVPYRTGSWVTKVQDNKDVKRITVCNGSRSYELEAEMLAVGYHLVPNTELAQMLGCHLKGGFVQVNAQQETSVSQIYCVGEATGIGGVDKALLEGRIAALSASGRTKEAHRLYAARDRQLRFAQHLAATFQLRPELRRLADPVTIVCRCEDVPHDSLQGCGSWREAKLHTRCGMGPCQGRICGPATQFLYGWTLPQPRPPLFPVELSALNSTEAPVATSS